MPISLALCFALAAGVGAENESEPRAVASVAVRVHHTEAMVRFYSEAFGIDFRTVELPSFTMYEGRFGETLFKFVPIREQADPTGFPVHQLGFTVHDIQQVIDLAERHGGSLLQLQAEAEPGTARAAIRDPDGNTIELYGRE